MAPKQRSPKDPMHCFEFELNGQRCVTAGLRGFGVVAAHLTWVRRRGEGAGRASIDIGGLDCVFHAISITDSTASRSGIPREADHPFHAKSITFDGVNRSG